MGGRQASRSATRRAARRLGIGMVFQHFSLFETLTVAENIALALESSRVGHDLSDRIREVSSRYGLPLEPDRHVHTMSVGERQRVEIVRCLLQNPRLLIMDEPTSVLTPQRSRACSRRWRRSQTRACRSSTSATSSTRSAPVPPRDRAACRSRHRRMRSATGDLRLARSDDDRRRPARPMHREARVGAVRLAIDHLTVPSADPSAPRSTRSRSRCTTARSSASQACRANGQQELMAALSASASCPTRTRSASTTRRSGTKARRSAGCAGSPSSPRSASGAARCRTCRLPRTPCSPRIAQGMVSRASSATTRCATCCGRDDRRVRRSRPAGRMRRRAAFRRQPAEVHRRTRDPPAPAPPVVSQPTWGVDVGASAQIRQALIDLSNRGVAVLVVSEELDELFEICDRLVGDRAGAPVAREARRRDQSGGDRTVDGRLVHRRGRYERAPLLSGRRPRARSRTGR